VTGWGPSERGSTYVWGLSPAKQFLTDNDLVLIVRAHEIVQAGFDFPFDPDNSVVTVFSATNADDSMNKACFMTINADETMTFTELPHPRPKKRAPKQRPAVTPVRNGRKRK
jgi:serine/threonine-protein phosphatase PP1 catalytic subunit